MYESKKKSHECAFVRFLWTKYDKYCIIIYGFLIRNEEIK